MVLCFPYLYVIAKYIPECKSTSEDKPDHPKTIANWIKKVLVPIISKEEEIVTALS